MSDATVIEPRVIGVATDYGELHEIFRERAEFLGASRDTLDEISGLPAGYITPRNCSAKFP